MDITTALARQIMAESNFTAEDVNENTWQGKVVLGPVWERVYSEVVYLEPSVLGIIAATGKAVGDDCEGVRLYQVHCWNYLAEHERDSGLDLLRIIATTALMARMADLAKEPITSSA